MKHRIKKHLSLIIALSMLLSMIPFYGAAIDDEFAGFETLEEIPFEFELEPGDLPFEQLKDAVLAAEDIPACIDPALAEARGHVNRLYLQEPDDYTVMFQNRDGSKTVYVFSQPVKGSTISTEAAIQVNNGLITFSGSNAIASLISELHDYNIGYCEIVTLNSGILSADGVNITADAREWAREASSASNLVYNMSSEAAAEYNMSISENATASIVPGITITPIDPTPEGGITVMAISYSTLAGLMSFKNVSTNRYLTLTTSSSPSLTTNASIVNPYSRWYVQYDSDFGYKVSNLSGVYSTYLGFDFDDEFIIGSNSIIEYTLSVNIESTSDSIVTIKYEQLALNSTGQLYEKSASDAAFPSSCQWIIVSKKSTVLITGFSAQPTTRIEQSGVGFYLDYTVRPSTANTYDISLYDATTNQEITHDTEAYEDEYAYYIDDPGIYTVYYKDNTTGVTSANFTLIITGSISDIRDGHTYTIQPKNDSTKYLTMNAQLNANGVYQADSNIISVGTIALQNNYEAWNTISRSFVLKYTSTGYKISASLATAQYLNVPNGESIEPITSTVYSDEYYVNYELTSRDEEQNNALNYGGVQITYENELRNKLITNSNNANQSSFSLYPIPDMPDYYIIICGYSGSNVMALEYNQASNCVVAMPIDFSEIKQQWQIKEIGVDAPLIKQTTDYWCGYTTALQCLYGKQINLDLNETELNLHEEIKYVAEQIGSTTGDASRHNTYSNMISIWNNDSSITAKYDTVDYSDYSCDITESQARTHISNSLNNGWCPIFLTQQGGMPYKEGSKTFHYICIIGFDSASDCVIIANCHYNNDIFGIYAVDFSSFYDAIAMLYWVE